MGNDPRCRHCERRLVWGFVDYSDTKGWVHANDDESLCEPLNDGSTQAEPFPDPYPVGCRVRVRDHDGIGILGPFKVVRSYWPTACVELLTDDGMVRQNHDRIIP